TAFDPGKDAKDDAEPLVSGAGTVAEEDESPTDDVAGTNTTLAFVVEGRVYRVNTRHDVLFAGQIGVAAHSNGKHRIADQWIDERYQNTYDGVNFTAAAGTEPE